MFKVRQRNFKESEERENKRWNRSSKNSEGSVYKTYLNDFIKNLQSKKIIIVLCLAAATFLIIPMVTILLAFLAGRWLRFTGEKSLKQEYV